MRKYSRSRHPHGHGWRASWSAASLTLLAACAGPAPVASPPAAVAATVTAPPAMPGPAASAVPIDPGSPASSAPGAAAAPALRPGAPLSYTVQRGDTLWDIANRFLLDPWQWPEIWQGNGQVRNPHLIYPGDRLRLVDVNGHPQLALETGRSSIGPDLEHVSPQIRELPLEEAIPTIPIDAIRQFLRGPRLVTPEELKGAPYLLSFVDGHIIGGEGTLIYVRKLPAHEPWSYALVRPGQVYHDPDNGQVIGYEALPIGSVDVKEPGEPATALLSHTEREALIGDRLLPAEADAFHANFYPHAPDHAIGGRIIAAFDGLSQISQYQIVAINRGSDHGLEAGHVLQILQGGSRVDDPYSSRKIQLPDQPAGQLLVFKTTPRLSYGLVMSVTRPAHLLDKVEKPRSTR